MADDEITKHDFSTEFPIPSDLDRDKIKFQQRKDGYSINYNDRKEYKHGNTDGFSSYSVHVEETYGKDVENAKMEVDSGMIKVTGSFRQLDKK